MGKPGAHPLDQMRDMEGVLVHSFMRTRFGMPIYVDEPEQMLDRNMILIEDIAWSLSQSNRYNGHTFEPYYVGQHVCIVHDLAEERDRGWALHHDDPEAYMGDCVSPWKRYLKSIWSPMERRWEFSICERFGIGHPDEAQQRRVKALDILVLGREMIDLMTMGEEDQKNLGYLDKRRPHDILDIRPWSPQRCRDEYMARFKALAQGV